MSTCSGGNERAFVRSICQSGQDLLEPSPYDMASALAASALCQPSAEVLHGTKHIAAELKTSSRACRGEFIQPFRRIGGCNICGDRTHGRTSTRRLRYCVYYTLAEGVPSLARSLVNFASQLAGKRTPYLRWCRLISVLQPASTFVLCTGRSLVSGEPSRPYHCQRLFSLSEIGRLAL